MRSLPTTFRAALEDPHNDDPPLVFLTLSHADLTDPIRCVWDTVDYVLSSNTYIGFPFEISLPSDGDGEPQGRLTIQNVDRRIGEAVLALSGPPLVTIEIYAASDWDLTVVPRVPLGTPALAYRAGNLYFRQISVDASTASGALTSWNFASQPWPGKVAMAGILPGLFR